MSEPTELDTLRLEVAAQHKELRRIKKAYRSCRQACDDLDHDYMHEFKNWERLQIRLAHLENRYHILPPPSSTLRRKTQQVKEKAVMDLASSLNEEQLAALIIQLSGELDKK